MEQVQTRVRHKSFNYSTTIDWLEKRAGSLASDGKPSFRVASPPEFKGEAGVWTPEDLFVAAVEACTMTTFLSFAGRLKIPVVSYSSTAEGMLEFTDEGYSFTKVIVRPTIVIRSEGSVELTRKTVDDAHRSCLIANSIKSIVVVEPVVEIETAGA